MEKQAAQGGKLRGPAPPPPRASGSGKQAVACGSHSLHFEDELGKVQMLALGPGDGVTARLGGPVGLFACLSL